MRSRSSSSIAPRLGAAVREKSPKKADRASLARPKRPADEEVMKIVRAYSSGEMSIKELRDKYGLKSRQTLYNWMLAAVGDREYHEMVTHCLVNRISDSDEKLEEAQDQVEVQKAVAYCRFTRQDYERRRPALYGQKQLNVNVHEVRVSGLQGRATELLEVKEIQGEDE